MYLNSNCCLQVRTPSKQVSQKTRTPLRAKPRLTQNSHLEKVLSVASDLQQPKRSVAVDSAQIPASAQEEHQAVQQLRAKLGRQIEQSMAKRDHLSPPSRVPKQSALDDSTQFAASSGGQEEQHAVQQLKAKLGRQIDQHRNEAKRSSVQRAPAPSAQHVSERPAMLSSSRNCAKSPASENSQSLWQQYCKEAEGSALTLTNTPRKRPAKRDKGSGVRVPLLQLPQDQSWAPRHAAPSRTSTMLSDWEQSMVSGMCKEIKKEGFCESTPDAVGRLHHLRNQTKQRKALQSNKQRSQFGRSRQ